MGKKLGGRKWRKNRGGSNKSGRLQRGIEQGKKDDDFVLYTLIYKFITAFSSKAA